MSNFNKALVTKIEAKITELNYALVSFLSRSSTQHINVEKFAYETMLHNLTKNDDVDQLNYAADCLQQMLKDTQQLMKSARKKTGVRAKRSVCFAQTEILAMLEIKKLLPAEVRKVHFTD